MSIKTILNRTLNIHLQTIKEELFNYQSISLNKNYIKIRLNFSPLE